MLTFRPAAEGDWPANEALLLRSALPLDGAREHLGAFLPTLDEGALVATAAIETSASAGLLRSVAVAESHRGRGIGEAILRLMILVARRRDVRTLPPDDDRQELFSRRGFAKASRADAPREPQASAEFKGACIFGAHGYGGRQGLLTVPARVAQALAPWIFGLCLDRWGVGALTVSASIGLLALGTLFLLPAADPSA